MRIGSSKKYLNESKKNKEDKDLIEMVEDDTKLKIETIIPISTALIILALLGVFAFWQIEAMIKGNEANIEENIAIEEVEFDKDFSLHSTLEIGEKRVENLVKLAPTETPVVQNIQNVSEIGYRNQSKNHLISETVEAIEKMEGMLAYQTREELLKIEGEKPRAMFLETHLKDIEILLSRAVNLRQNLETNLVYISGKQAEEKQDYENEIVRYNEAYAVYDGNKAEKALQEALEKHQEISLLTKKYEFLSFLQGRLTAYEAALRKKQYAIQENFEALIAGVQIKLIEDVDLGLIRQ